MHRPGVKLAICRSLVRRRTTTLPSQPQRCGRGLWTVMIADYINFLFKFTNFRYRGNRGWSEANYIVQLHSLTREQPLGYLVNNRGRICYTKSSYGEFSAKIFIFSLPWQQGSSEQSLTDSIKLTDPENPLVSASIWRYQLHKLSYSRFCAENCKFSLPWRQGSVRAKCDWHSLIGRPRKLYHRTKNYDSVLYATEVMANFLVKFRIFRYHGNRGRLSKV